MTGVTKTSVTMTGVTMTGVTMMGVTMMGIGLILIIQTFDPSTLSVLYNKDVCSTSSIV